MAMKYILPGTAVDYQDCRWTVVWSDGERVCIRSRGGSEVQVIPVANVRPADKKEG